MMDDKEPSIYMRFHITLEKAINFIKHLYGNDMVPHTQLSKLQYSIKLAGMTEQIQIQDYLDYHLTWLVGALKDTYNINIVVYRQNIDQVLSSLKDEESKRIQYYIESLNADSNFGKGQQYKNMLDRIANMDVIPCYIKIFELYNYCNLWKMYRWEKKIQQYQGFRAYAYLFWYRAISKHITIGKNIKQYIKQFFKEIETQIGGINSARKKAEYIFNLIE